MKKTKFKPHKSFLNMDANVTIFIVFISMIVISWIPYIQWLTWLLPLFIGYKENESSFVKFYAATAFLLGLFSFLIRLVLQIVLWLMAPSNYYDSYAYLLLRGWRPAVAVGMLSYIIGGTLTIVLFYLIYQSFQYRKVSLPIIGGMADKISQKIEKIKSQNAVEYDEEDELL